MVIPSHKDQRVDVRGLLQVLMALCFLELEDYYDLESSMLQPFGRYQVESTSPHLEMVGVDKDNDLQSKRRNSREMQLGPESGYSCSPRGGSRPGSGASLPQMGGSKLGESGTRVLAGCSASPDDKDAEFGNGQMRS